LRLRRRLDLCYGIEVNGAACGLIGLYDLTPEGLAHVALAIFDRSARGKGIGSRAFSLLTDMLRSHPVARLLLAEVKEHDEAAVRFWTKQGFAQTAAGTGGTIIVSLDLCGGA
jgi:ribosomal protein S18 acetylase RimI-like enzyme